MKWLRFFRKRTEPHTGTGTNRTTPLHFGREFLQEGAMQRYRSIAMLLSRQDPEVLQELERCMMQPTSFVTQYAQRFALRCLDPVALSTDERIWISMVDSLIVHGYAEELDYKCTYSDLTSALEQLRNWGDFNLELPFRYKEPEGELPDWCQLLDQTWEEADSCIGGIDIDSDSYVIFLIKQKQLHALRELAAQLQHRITYAAQL